MSRLPEEARNWIEKNVDSHMDWNAIKSALRLTHKYFDYMDTNPDILPICLLIHYQDINQSKLSKKAYTDKDSVNEWMKCLVQQGLDVLFNPLSSSSSSLQHDLKQLVFQSLERCNNRIKTKINSSLDNEQLEHTLSILNNTNSSLEEQLNHLKDQISNSNIFLTLESNYLCFSI
ncbi:hypothetical protein BDA99DRAFT_558434 [Phascolomyces articulosus]|uniref:Uncharacterized protein n=1 Tax=Phascolomyces articulosus TaxID=60185 RepID=A0AAD5KER1_9FUNG|nr:hypothetical protein BDA99DRAFT_558434 [Phascolomyces articulosus]